ncbi:MAG TPA: hypothetical protein VM261_22960 [Kofleriaceae bacterium]|nr:hypothetical protein [Kofleriaceae bacterium]
MGSLARVLALGALAACDRPHPLVICHNANCTGDTSPANSDTIPGLQAALALTNDGRRLVDGVELDFLWDAPRERCAFAHDAETAPARADASAAVAELRRWALFNEGPLIVVIDAKNTGSADDVPRLAACVADAGAALAFPVLEGELAFRVYLSSGDPSLLRAIDERLALLGHTLPLTAGFASPAPLGNAPPLSDFADIPLEGISAHPRWLTDQQVRAFDDAGLDLFLWTHILTTETLDSIDRYEPYAVGTDDVELLRGWIDGWDPI